MRHNVLAILFIGLASIGATDCQSVRPDSEMSPLEAFDSTALIQGDGRAVDASGCEKTLQSGYTYCRVREGAVSESSIYLVTPVTKCSREVCRTWEIYFPDGSPTLGGAFGNDQTRVEVKWKDLVKRDTFEKADRGFWIYLITSYWINPDGQEMKTVVDGEIRLRVYSKKYKSLRYVSEDPNFVYSWVENGVEIKSTSSGRTYIGAEP